MVELRQSVATFSHGANSKLSFVFLVYLDLVLTLLAVGNGFSEMNPFMQRMLAKPAELALVKGVAPLFIAWLVPAKLLIPAIVLMLGVIGWNARELLAAL